MTPRQAILCAILMGVMTGELDASTPATLSDRRDAQREYAATLTWGRDPFTRAGAAGQVSGLTLSGILWDAKDPMAIVNGEMVHIGEEIDGYRIVEITPERVSVSDDIETFQLLLAP